MDVEQAEAAPSGIKRRGFAAMSKEKHKLPHAMLQKSQQPAPPFLHQ